MTKEAFDFAAGHRYFAAHCFNSAWDLIEKSDRTPEEDRLMVAMNQASIYHWLHREDCGNQQLSVGFWQASRIHSVLRNAEEARKYAEVCLDYSTNLSPFYKGYAHEALARAAKLAGSDEYAANLIEKAKAFAMAVEEKDEQELLLNDLAAL